MCRRQKREKFLMSRAFTVENILKISNWSYCQTQKTVNTWKISGMLIVYWPITIKFRIRKQTSKPQTNYRCCLRFSYLAPYWLISRNTITFHKYFWCSRFCEFHSKNSLFLTFNYCRYNIITLFNWWKFWITWRSILFKVFFYRLFHGSRITIFRAGLLVNHRNP